MLVLLLVPILSGRCADGPQHSAVIPAARSGRPMERHLQLNQRVQEHQGKLDVVFIGDSITQGWEGAGRKVWDIYYGHRKALNLGIGGDRTQHVLWRFQNGNLDGIDPDVAVVMIGTNNSGNERNSASEIVDGITAVVEQLRSRLPRTKVLLLAIFPRGQEFNPQRGKILQVNQAIRKLADGDQVVYLDFGHELIEPDGSIHKEVMPDYLHLSERGYRIWAEAIEDQLSTWLGDERVVAMDLTGDWIWTIRGPEGRMMEAPLTLKAEGGRLSGTFGSENGRELPIKEGTLRGNQLVLTVSRDRPQGGTMVYHMTGTVQDGKIEGTVEADMDGETVRQPWRAWRKEP